MKQILKLVYKLNNNITKKSMNTLKMIAYNKFKFWMIK